MFFWPISLADPSLSVITESKFFIFLSMETLLFVIKFSSLLDQKQRYCLGLA